MVRSHHSRDHRPGCVQIVIALIVTPEGLPLAYEVLAGNTGDSTTLRDFLAKIEDRDGKADQVWRMDRGIPTEAMRRADPPVHYPVGTPKGRPTRLEQAPVAKPWHDARPDVRVKLLPEDGELYVFAESIAALAPGLTLCGALERFAAVQMVDVHVPTTDGRELSLTRHTQPEPELALILERLKPELPAQPPPRISAA